MFIKGAGDGLPDILQVIGINRVFDSSHVDYIARRIPEHFQCQLRCPEPAGVDIQFPESRPGGIGCQAEAGFALAQTFFRFFAGQGITEYLGHQLQPLNDLIRPVTLLLQRIKGDHTDQLSASDRERQI